MTRIIINVDFGKWNGYMLNELNDALITIAADWSTKVEGQIIKPMKPYPIIYLDEEEEKYSFKVE